jgi:hypothetical protein
MSARCFKTAYRCHKATGNHQATRWRRAHRLTYPIGQRALLSPLLRLAWLLSPNESIGTLESHRFSQTSHQASATALASVLAGHVLLLAFRHVVLQRRLEWRSFCQSSPPVVGEGGVAFAFMFTAHRDKTLCRSKAIVFSAVVLATQLSPCCTIELTSLSKPTAALSKYVRT